MHLGFCGLGGMGAAMVARLIERGHVVTVWNRTAAKATPLLEVSAIWAASPAEVAAQSEIVITCLFDDAAVADVYGVPRSFVP